MAKRTQFEVQTEAIREGIRAGKKLGKLLRRLDPAEVQEALGLLGETLPELRPRLRQIAAIHRTANTLPPQRRPAQVKRAARRVGVRAASAPTRKTAR